MKLLDFGLSRVIKQTPEFNEWVSETSLGPDGLMTTQVGTPSFAAPEMLSGFPYGREVDCFACGIVMYWLLCGYYPFSDLDPDKLLELIRQTEFDFPDKEWSTISDDAKELVKGLLDRSPYGRLSAEQALQHSWFDESSTSPQRSREYAEEVEKVEQQEMTYEPEEAALSALEVSRPSYKSNVKHFASLASLTKTVSSPIRLKRVLKKGNVDSLVRQPNRHVSWSK